MRRLKDSSGARAPSNFGQVELVWLLLVLKKKGHNLQIMSRTRRTEMREQFFTQRAVIFSLTEEDVQLLTPLKAEIGRFLNTKGVRECEKGPKGGREGEGQP